MVAVVSAIWCREGGHRVVGIASWQGTIPGGRVTAALASTLDFLPTIAALAGAPLPAGRVFDGVDLTPLLTGEADTAHTTLFHPLSGSCGVGPLKAQRWMTGGHAYKLMWKTGGALGCMDRPAPGTQGVDTCTDHDPPLLFDLSVDPAEADPIDTAKPPGATVLETMVSQLQAVELSINTTARSVANYRGGPAGKDANCCNSSHIECRCNAGI